MQTTPTQVPQSESVLAKHAMMGLRGEFLVEKRPNYCLKFVRQVFEKAYRLADRGFYAIIDRGFTPQGRQRAYAADVEAACRVLKFDVPVKTLLPGDIVFSSKASPKDANGVYYGHVGIYVGLGLIAENTASNRGKRFGGALALTPISSWDKITTVARIPATKPRPKS